MATWLIYPLAGDGAPIVVSGQLRIDGDLVLVVNEEEVQFASALQNMSHLVRDTDEGNYAA